MQHELINVHPHMI